MTTFESLNEDCLESIFEYLSLDDQMAIRNVCKRYSGIIEGLWKRKYKTVNLGRKYDEFAFENNPAKLYDFLSGICSSVERITFESIESTTLNRLQDLSFPKVQHLDLNVYYRMKFYRSRNSDESDDSDESSEYDLDDNNDWDTEILVKIFPNLTTLKLSSCISGKDIWNFRKLTELDLSCCEFLNTKYFKQIFNTLKLRKFSLLYYGYNTLLNRKFNAILDCKTLEELQIDDHHLSMIIQDALNLPNLRKIATYTRDYDDYLLGIIAKIKGPLMERMLFNGVFWSHDTHSRNVAQMINLECFICYDDDIKDEQMIRMAKSLKNLRELYLLKSHFQSDNGLLAFVQHCPTLELFDISETKVNGSFVKRVVEIIEKQILRCERRKPLLMRCYNTNITKDDCTDVLLPSLMTITLEKKSLELLSTRFLECQWRLASEKEEAASTET